MFRDVLQAIAQAIPQGPDWGKINTALILAAIFYLYRQARVTESVRQLILGAGGEDAGLVGEMKLVRERTHDLSDAIIKLDGTVMRLNDRLDAIEERDARDTALILERRNTQRGGM